MNSILDIEELNPMAAIIAVGKDIGNAKKIIICSDYEFRTRKLDGSKSEIIVTIPDNKSGENDLRKIIKINSCPIGSDHLSFNTHVIDNNNLKIMIIN